MLTAGQNQFDSNIIKATKGRIYFKRGAEGIGFVGDRKYKIGGAIKVEDGNMRALPIATLALLNQFKLINKNESCQNKIKMSCNLFFSNLAFNY